MIWSKIKQQLEGFLCPSLIGRVEYRATGYRYLPDKSGLNYITVNKKEIFNMKDTTTMIRWYQTEQEIKNDPNLFVPIYEEDIEKIRKETNGTVPEERIIVIAKNQKASIYAKELLAAQTTLCKADFYHAANQFLSQPIEKSLDSKAILFNIFALIDRRVGKKRLLGIEERIKSKHPIVQYFYRLRMNY